MGDSSYRIIGDWNSCILGTSRFEGLRETSIGAYLDWLFLSTAWMIMNDKSLRSRLREYQPIGGVLDPSFHLLVHPHRMSVPWEATEKISYCSDRRTPEETCDKRTHRLSTWHRLLETQPSKAVLMRMLCKHPASTLWFPLLLQTELR